MNCTCDEAPRPSLPPAPPTLPDIEAASFGSATGDDAIVLSSFSVNLPALGIAIGIFFILHLGFHKLFYNNVARGHSLAVPSRFGCMSGFGIALFMSDDCFIELAGVDAAALIEFIRLAMRITVSFALWSLCTVLAPIAIAVADDRNSFLERASLANLKAVGTDGAPEAVAAFALAASTIGMWLNSFVALWLINRSWTKVIGWCRVKLTDASDVQCYTLLVRAVDPRQKPIKHDDTLRMWRGLYPDEVFSLRMVRATGTLPTLLKKYDAIAKNLEQLEAKKAALDEAGKLMEADKPKLLCLASLNSSIAKLSKKLATQALEVAAARAKYCADASDAGLSYFVMFNSSRAATIASQVRTLPEMAYEITPAPVPEGVCWNALQPLAIQTAVPRRVVGIVGYYLVLFFYSVPIALINTLLTLSNLYTIFPPIRTLLEAIGPTAESFLIALLPTVALLVFLAVLPSICYAFASLHGFASVGQVAGKAFSGLFLFNFVWVFLGMSIGSSLLGSVQAIINKPSEILELLSSGLAGASTFYITCTTHRGELTEGDLPRARVRTPQAHRARGVPPCARSRWRAQTWSSTSSS